MKKFALAALAAVSLGLAPIAGAHAEPLTDSFIVNGHTWDINIDGFGVNEVDDDGYDDSHFSVSLDNGVSFNDVECQDESFNSLADIVELNGGALVTCLEPDTTVAGVSTDMYSYTYASGLITAVTYVITNTSGADLDLWWQFEHNYGEGDINDAMAGSNYSYGNGESEGTTPAATGWGLTGDDCRALSGDDDGYDNMEVESSICTLAADETVALTFFHLISEDGTAGTVNSLGNALIEEREDDATLAAGIPSHLFAWNFDLQGTLDIDGTPEEETPEGETSELAETGFDVQSGLTLVAAALFAGLAALVAARRRAARSL